MVNVDLKEFVCTGGFGSIHFGMTRRELEQMLGSPTDRTPEVNGLIWSWMYGDVQFDWDISKDDRLYCIHVVPREVVPSGCPSLVLTPWVIRLGMVRAEFQKHLRSSQIPYWLVDEGPDFGFVRLGAGPGVRISFNEGEADETCPSGLLGVEYSPLYPGPPIR
jgi:hypothetical protein